MLHCFGPKWFVFRLNYAIRLRFGMLRRRIPATNWQAQPLKDYLDDPSLAEPEAFLDYRRNHAPPFFFKSSFRKDYLCYFPKWDNGPNNPVVLANEIMHGKFRYFEHTNVKTGFPPDWNCNPFTRQKAPPDQHWSKIPDFGFGDIKIIWELNRFGFAYILARAYWRSRDERYPELFWHLVEDWRINNPPQLGANWKCGQEISIRVMACCFALYAFLESTASTAERVIDLAQMISAKTYE